jgi:hypothetical protein
MIVAPLGSQAAVIIPSPCLPQQESRAELHFEVSANSQQMEERATEPETIVEAEKEKEEEQEDLWSSLDEALQEMGYDIHTTAILLTNGDLPPELIALVARKVSMRPELVKPMLIAQCPVLLPRVLRVIEQINHELMLQRLAGEAIELADRLAEEAEQARIIEENEAKKARLVEEKARLVAEKARLIEAERQRKYMAVMERVKMIGRCCMGYEWHKAKGGYRCGGGSHFVSDSMVNCG